MYNHISILYWAWTIKSMWTLFVTVCDLSEVTPDFQYNILYHTILQYWVANDVKIQLYIIILMQLHIDENMCTIYTFICDHFEVTQNIKYNIIGPTYVMNIHSAMKLNSFMIA